MTITKKEMCHLLYCLNSHTKIASSAAGRRGLPESEREALRDRIAAFKALKGKVLAKLVYNGHAKIRGIQTNKRVNPPAKHYSIKVRRGFNYHTPVCEEFEELLDEEEKTGDNNPCKTQERNS